MVFYRSVCVCVCEHRSYLPGFTIFFEEPVFSCICDMLSHYTTNQYPSFSSEILEFLKYSTNLMKLELFTSRENLTVSKNRKWILFSKQRCFEWPFLTCIHINTALPFPFLFCLFVCIPRKYFEALSQLLRLENSIYSWFLPLFLISCFSLWCLSIIYSEWVPNHSFSNYYVRCLSMDSFDLFLNPCNGFLTGCQLLISLFQPIL